MALMLGAGCISGGDDDDGDQRCGNGVKEPGEQCDDGNRIDHDGCSAECEVEGFCGNSIREPGEECDDGNFTPGDGCTAECEVEEGCGNGRLDVGEECDDDNLYDLDGCNALCQDEEPGAVCGNGIHELGEGCDDGNNDPGDGCDGGCQREDGCGDGVLQGAELCDDGNNISGDGCSADCVVEYICGNEYCEEDNYETCEACPQDCCPSCGDGVLDEGEGCDDGNNESGDGCSRGCNDEDSVAECGNGIWEAGEECEDGNLEIHDGCSDTCEVEFECGDQVCERDMGESCERCQPDCCPNCGNGVLEPLQGEWCDHTELGGVTCTDIGYTGGTLACTDWCTHDTSGCDGSGPSCGNDTAEYGEDCDGSDLRGKDCVSLGWSGGNLGCSGSCGYDTSGCTGLVWYFHEDFEDQGDTLQRWIFSGSWDWGSPSAGPSQCLDGSSCVGTNMAGNYSSSLSYSTCVLESPPIDLGQATSPVLSLFMWLQTEDYDDDGGTVMVSNDGGASWATLTPDGGYDGTVDGEPAFYGDKAGQGWHRGLFDLSAYAGDTIQLRFAFSSDSYSEYPGWYLDAMYITEAAEVPVQITSGVNLGLALPGEAWSHALSADGGIGSFAWSIQPGGTNDAWLSIDAATGTLSGTPLAVNLGPVTVNVRATVAGNPSNYSEKSFEIDVVDGVWAENFDANPTGWTFGGEWQWGTPSGTGPSVCDSGSCIGVNMSGDYSNNLDWSTCTATSPSIDLTGTSGTVILEFRAYVDTEGSSWDGGNLKVSTDGSTFSLLSSVTPAYNLSSVGGEQAWGDDTEPWSVQWSTFTADLSAYAGQTIWLRFAFRSDSSVTYPGIYIDNLVLYN